MGKLLKTVAWVLVACIGAFALAGVALRRGEAINSAWLVAAAVCTYLAAYRFYSAFIAAKVMALDDRRATPAERLRNGHDFEPTNKWIVFGHHFAAIAGPGPLVGPTLAAQFGYLPGTLWIILGVVLGGAVQDFVILFASVRRDGKSLGQMAREEIGRIGGGIALLTVLLIMIILLAVIGLVVVNALKGSPWGTFTIAATMPIAVFMGLYLRYWRPGRVLEVSVIGFLLVVASIFAGEWVAHHPVLGPWFTLGGLALAVALILYGYAASALPVWLLLAPRDYLSTFVKLGVVLLLGLGVLIVRPDLRMPALTQFTNGEGPIFAGRIFPFCFITIACGAISGFHSLISSGTTPKLIARESHIRPVGYGSMLLESFVAMMAMVAACALEPGVFFAVNSPAGIVGATPEAATATITGLGLPGDTAARCTNWRSTSAKQTLLLPHGRRAVAGAGDGAHLLADRRQRSRRCASGTTSPSCSKRCSSSPSIDAGTRVGRFMLQDFLGHIWRPLGRTSWMPSVLLTSGLIVAAWGYFLVQGVLDPLGGINSLWPLFGIANQLLAAVALCVATTILIKMHGAKYMWITTLPLAWLVTVTFAGAWQKIFSDAPRVGFLAQARLLEAGPQTAQTKQLIFNNRLDAVVCGIFLVLVAAILADSVRIWFGLLRGTREAQSFEAPFVPSQLEAEELG